MHAGVKLPELYLETECEGKEVTVVGFVLTHDLVTL